MPTLPIQDFVHLATGRWSGVETLAVDPASGRTMQAMGRFETRPAFAGAGFASSYTQSMDGRPGLASESLYRLADDDTVTLLWFPADGDPQVMRGRREGAVITVSRTGDDGLAHTLVTDYSRMGTVEIRMQLTPPGGQAFTAFTGQYARLGTAEDSAP